MKANLRFGIVCLCLAVLSGLPSLYAQETQPPDPPKQEAEQKPATLQEAAKKTPPKPPAVPLEVNTSDGGFAIEPFYWMTSVAGKSPAMRNGTSGNASAPSDLNFGKSKPAPGVIVSLPGGGDNNVRFSYWVAKGSGTTFVKRDQSFFNTSYVAGDLLVPRYSLHNAKISYDYLTYPNPPTSRFRIKTLWELQGVWFQTTITAPQKPIAFDNAGNPISNTAIGTNWFVYPTFGLGVEHFVSRHFYWQAKGSGFAFPGRSNIWDAEFKAAMRVGHFEAQVGANGFHFRTSPKRAQYVNATLLGPYVSFQYSFK